MATTTVKWYGKALIAWANKEVDLVDDAIHEMFTNATEVPDQDLDDYVDDFIANEVTGTNLATGGVALDNDTLTYTGGTNVLKYDADDESIANVTATGIKNIHIADRTPATDATRPVIAYGILDTAVSPSAGTLLTTWDANGIVTMTAAA